MGRRGIGKADGPEVRRTTCSDMQYISTSACTFYWSYSTGSRSGLAVGTELTWQAWQAWLGRGSAGRVGELQRTYSAIASSSRPGLSGIQHSNCAAGDRDGVDPRLGFLLVGGGTTRSSELVVNGASDGPQGGVGVAKAVSFPGTTTIRLPWLAGRLALVGGFRVARFARFAEANGLSVWCHGLFGHQHQQTWK